MGNYELKYIPSFMVAASKKNPYNVNLYQTLYFRNADPTRSDRQIAFVICCSLSANAIIVNYVLIVCILSL